MFISIAFCLLTLSFWTLEIMALRWKASKTPCIIYLLEQYAYLCIGNRCHMFHNKCILSTPRVTDILKILANNYVPV